jgi:hypothetical protein
MTPPPRDYVAELEARVTVLLAQGGDVLPALAAAQIVDELRHSDPDLLDGFLRVSAQAVIADLIRARNRVNRTQTGRNPKRAAFAVNSAAGIFDIYRLKFEMEGGGLRPIGDMTVSDCLWLAGQYRVRADSNTRRASFFDDLAKLVESKSAGTVAAAVDAGTLMSMWESAVR